MLADVDGSPQPLPAIGAASPVNFGNLSNPFAQAAMPSYPAAANYPAPATYSTPAVSAPSIPSNAAPTVGPTVAQIQATPQYLQAIQNVDLWAQQQQAALDFNQDWTTRNYNQALSQITQADPLFAQQQELARAAGLQGYRTQQQQIDQAREAEQRRFQQQRKYVKEALTGRGNAGGQLGFEVGNLEFGHNQALSGLNLNAENAQFALDQLTQEMDLDKRRRDLQQGQTTSNLSLQNQQDLAALEVQKKNLSSAIAEKRGSALLQVMSLLMQMRFRDGPQGMGYYGEDGGFVTTEQAAASLPGGGASLSAGLAPGESTVAAQIPAAMTMQQAQASVSPFIRDLLGQKGY